MHATDPRRFASVDALRGLTVAAMLLVNDPGDWGHVYAPLLHAEHRRKQRIGGIDHQCHAQRNARPSAIDPHQQRRRAQRHHYHGQHHRPQAPHDAVQ